MKKLTSYVAHGKMVEDSVGPWYHYTEVNKLVEENEAMLELLEAIADNDGNVKAINYLAKRCSDGLKDVTDDITRGGNDKK